MKQRLRITDEEFIKNLDFYGPQTLTPTIEKYKTVETPKRIKIPIKSNIKQERDNNSP